MTVSAGEVLLLKAQSAGGDTDDKYTVLLENRGFKVKTLQTIDFAFVNAEGLREKLRSRDDYSGIIFSSPRSVTAVAKLNRKELDGWANKRNYVIGEATFRLAQELLLLDCDGKETGNASLLADKIVSDRSKYEKPRFLYPCGNLSLGVLQEKLQAENIGIDAVVVYETITNPSLEADFSSYSADFSQIAEYVVFFSPSGVSATAPLLAKIPTEYRQKIKFVAIGPSSQKAAVEAGLQIAATAEKPTPDSLAECIANIS